jgi:hypothetical protein
VFHSPPPPSPSIYQSCNEQYRPIPTHVPSNPASITSHQMSLPPFQPSVQQFFYSKTAFPPNMPPVNQIANDPSTSSSMQHEPAASPASVASDSSMNSFISESTVSNILDLD